MHGARAITIAGVVAPGVIVVLNVHSLARPSFRAAGRAGAVRMPINGAGGAWAQITTPAQTRSVRDHLKSRQ